MNVPFFALFEDKFEQEYDVRKHSLELFTKMHNLIIQQFGLASTREIAGESTEMQKESRRCSSRCPSRWLNSRCFPIIAKTAKEEILLDRAVLSEAICRRRGKHKCLER